MSNQNSTDQAKPGEWQTDHQGKMTRSVQEFEMPDGRVAQVGLRIGNDRDESSDAEEGRAKFWQTVHPPELTRNLERETARLQQELNDLTGYDKDGQPIFRLQGRARQTAEMQLASRMSALKIAQRDRQYAEQVQAQKRADDAKRAHHIEERAQTEAKRLIDQAEIDRRAKQIAARSGVRVDG